MTKPTGARHGARKLMTAFVLTLALATVLAGPTFAAKRPSGGGTTTSSGSIAYAMVTDVNGNGAPNWGDSLTWTISQSSTTEPHVDLICSQNGVVVLSASTGFYASYPWPWTQTMTLRSTAWSGGAASCVGQLYYFSGTKTVVLATQSFTAGA